MDWHLKFIYRRPFEIFSRNRNFIFFGSFAKNFWIYKIPSDALMIVHFFFYKGGVVEEKVVLRIIIKIELMVMADLLIVESRGAITVCDSWELVFNNFWHESIWWDNSVFWRGMFFFMFLSIFYILHIPDPDVKFCNHLCSDHFFLLVFDIILAYFMFILNIQQIFRFWISSGIIFILLWNIPPTTCL